MASKGNRFAFLKDDDDGDVSPLLHPLHAPESVMPLKPHHVRSETRRGRGRGDRGRDSGRNSGTDVERSGRGQQKGMQKNQARENNYCQGNGYRRGYCEHRGRTNGYQQQNRGEYSCTKSDVHEKYNADSTKPYTGDSSNNKNVGAVQGHWHLIVGGRGRRSHEKNEFTNKDQVLEANQKHESKWLEKDSSGSQEKLDGGKSYRGDENQFRNGRSSAGGERRGVRKNNRGNWVAMRGNGEVKTSEGKETCGANEIPMGSAGKHTSMKE